MHVVNYNLLIAVALLVCLSGATAVSRATADEPVYRCEGKPQTLTLYESTTSRLYEHELALSGPGLFNIKVEAQEFSFEGYSYARTGTWSKWRLLQRSPQNQNLWITQYRLNQGELHQARLQLISSGPTCRTCTAKVTLNTSQCEDHSFERVSKTAK